jgi:hypothetical protein
VASELPAVLSEHIAAINAGDLNRATATFSADAYIGAEAEAWGTEAIRARLQKEFLDDSVSLEVRQVMEHQGDYVLKTKYEGTYDKTNLPDPLIMTNYYAIRDGKIISLIVKFIPGA